MRSAKAMASPRAGNTIAHPHLTDRPAGSRARGRRATAFFRLSDFHSGRAAEEVLARRKTLQGSLLPATGLHEATLRAVRTGLREATMSDDPAVRKAEA
ncbi:MAG: hypothetical protein ABEL04_15565 [Salinibacter sp.]